MDGDEDRRNECYPALPSVGWVSTRAARADRREAVDLRNALISEVGADRAQAVAKLSGGTIGSPKKEARGK